MPALHNNGLSLTTYVQNDPVPLLPYDALPVLLNALNKALLDDGSGILGARSGAALGYEAGTGGGGAVTQGTSRTTGVTLNTPTGQITMFTAAGSATPAQFTLTNSAIAPGDTLQMSQQGGSNNYVFAAKCGAGSAVLTFWAATGVASDAPIINYTLLKGAAT